MMLQILVLQTVIAAPARKEPVAIAQLPGQDTAPAFVVVNARGALAQVPGIPEQRSV